jgi:hypothetical protein
VLLVSVPYALEAGDAATLGGKPASAYLLAQPAQGTTAGPATVIAMAPEAVGATPAAAQLGESKSGPTPNFSESGNANYIPMYSDASLDLANSVMYQSGGNIGIGTTTPQAPVHVYGAGSTNTTLPGFLFQRPDTNATTHFQHYYPGISYVSQNMYRDVGGLWYLNSAGTAGMAMILSTNSGIEPPNINFLTLPTGGATLPTKLLVIQSSGNVGIGTTTPAHLLEVAGNINSSGTISAASFSGSGAGLTGVATTGANVFTGNQSVAASASGVTALAAQATDVASANIGVSGLANGAGGTGVYGEAENGSLAVGVWGISSSGYAGLFSGNVNVTGTITGAVKNFKIDDPLDPANKFLYHASVESSEMKTIYDGSVTLDARGEALVQLPEWFEAVNGDFRYQLTCVGGYAPVYIAQKIANHAFKIAGGTPGLEVDWQVTGVRHDAYARSHPLRVEVEKPTNERGYYLHPELFGQPPQRSLEWADHSAQMQPVRRAEGKATH